MRIESFSFHGLPLCVVGVHNLARLFRYGRRRQFMVAITINLCRVVPRRIHQPHYLVTPIGGEPRVLIVGEVYRVGLLQGCDEARLPECEIEVRPV